MFKFVVLAAALAYASAGVITSPALLAHSAPIVAHSAPLVAAPVVTAHAAVPVAAAVKTSVSSHSTVVNHGSPIVPVEFFHRFSMLKEEDCIELNKELAVL
ncbi:hypothetical protein NQ317_013272 [Molorchus minor]|uniref:Uncharacterized protein n=1 Tax=Molorchus minor TaxID=1323400 RepID=A0ABQ9IR18_9CUCU|nr:hypothetical protein NQ317_013272 [Molorchus minor]